MENSESEAYVILKQLKDTPGFHYFIQDLWFIFDALENMSWDASVVWQAQEDIFSEYI